MKTSTSSNFEGLRSRAELPGTDSEMQAWRSQMRLPLVAVPAPLKRAHPYRLRAGDFILYDGRICEVQRVNDCAAVILVSQPAREFTTLFGKQVRIKPKPRIVRIAANALVPILKRRSAKEAK
jgi:hypothetical protein